jgi:hypothetical protein
MLNLRSVGRGGLAVGLVALLAGAILAGGSAVIAGDWWLAREPWIGVGLTLLVVGLAMTAVFALVLDAVEPVGRLRFLALPPALIVGFFWTIWLVIGLPTTGFGGPERDIRTIIYSVPETLLVVLAATLLVPLPLVLSRFARSRTTVARSL